MADNEQTSANSIMQYSQNIDDATQPSPLPARDYRATVRSAERVANKAGDGHYWNVGFHIPASEYPADFTDGDEEGITLQYRRVGADDNKRDRWRVKRFIEAIGAPMPKKEVDANTWIGCEALVSIAHQDYEGEKQAQITRVQHI